MFWRRHKHAPVDETHLEELRGMYRALGLGFPPEAQRVFSGDEQADEGRWCLRHLGRQVRCLRTPDLSARELFALPGKWEVIRVVAHSLTGRRDRRGDRITVFGHFYCRPRGTAENVNIPFQHVWTMRAGRALLFENLVDATVLRREDPAAA